MNPHIGDNGIFDYQEPHSNGSDFLHAFEATLVGAAVGSALDNTRFGRWFNTSPSIGWIGRKIVQTLIVGSVICVGIYMYCLIKVW